ncbi:hypothetical protein FRC09_008704 [Ceratobasidium sp. 395]|nr:hypothetical protein FRC09_008704 [Ceratobasidium sp. 395]
MPPKGSHTVNLPEYIVQSGNGKVTCDACQSLPMKRKNLTRHFESEAHKDSLQVYESNKLAAAAQQLQQSAPVVLNPPLFDLPRSEDSSLPDTLNSTQHLDLNNLYTGDYSDTRFSAGESEGPGLNLPPRIQPTSALLEIHTGPALPEDQEETEERFTLPERILRSLAQEELDAEALQERFSGFHLLSDWCPYKSKIMFLLDLLDSIPRLRLSSEHLKLIMWVMEEAGCNNMPKFSELRETQNQLRKACAITSHHYRSSQGNHFEMLDIPQLIGRDFSNPLLAPHLVYYPEDSGNELSESWQAEKWRDRVPLEDLTPTYADGSKMYYVNELARLHDGRYVIPQRWITRNKVLTADCRLVDWQEDEGDTGLRVSEEIVSINAKAFASNYFDLVEHMTPSQYQFTASSQEFQDKMPNPLRKLAGDSEELVTCFIKPWCDDVSGGRTKQYQPHNNIYVAHANLPGHLLNQEYCVRFASTATHASSVEQFEAIKKQLDSNNENPIRVYNAATARYIRLRIYVLNVPADNRAQSEVASHMSGGNLPCRKCYVGGPYQVTETEEGYKAFFQAGQPRMPEETIQKIQEQIHTACLGVESHVGSLQTGSGVKDPTAQSIIIQLVERGREVKTKLKQPRKQVNDEDVMREQLEWLKSQPALPFNVLFQMHGLDPHRDTPVEILHTILLGVEKYAGHSFHSSTKDDAHRIFETRLQSADILGLQIDPTRASYVMRYKNNLIGRHFKMLMQLSAFQVHDIVSADMFALTKAVGDLGAVLFYSKITNLDEYLADLSVLVNNVLDAFTKLDPGRVIVKLKLHLLTHLVEDIRNHGLAVRYSTEVFECYNAVFRLCSILSNHQAPSQDIAHKMVDLERFRHIASGGYWEMGNSAMCASIQVRRFFETSLKLQSHLGYVKPEEIKAGEIELHSIKDKKTLKWRDTIGSRIATDSTFFEERDWHTGKLVTAANGDRCQVGSWVVATHDEATIIGRIQEILLDSRSEAHGIVTLNRFDVAEVRHPSLGMPMLVQSNADACYTTVIASYAISFALNVQHDCSTLRCSNSALEVIRQERRNTTLERQLVEHREDPIFIINMHALHNARRIREVLPRHLTEPIPLRSEQDRQTFIDASGRLLHERQTAKREAASRKRKEAREKRAREAEQGNENA